MTTVAIGNPIANAFAILTSGLTGPPTDGTWSEGSTVWTIAGEVWVCSEAGSPGVWHQSATYTKTIAGEHPSMSALASIVPTIRSIVSCPVCVASDNPITAKREPLAYAVVHLNDYHHWTREQIADWIDLLDIDTSIQRKEPA